MWLPDNINMAVTHLIIISDNQPACDFVMAEWHIVFLSPYLRDGYHHPQPLLCLVTKQVRAPLTSASSIPMCERDCRDIDAFEFHSMLQKTPFAS